MLLWTVQMVTLSYIREIKSETFIFKKKKENETWSFRWLMSRDVTVLGTFSGKPINFGPEASL